MAKDCRQDVRSGTRRGTGLRCGGVARPALAGLSRGVLAPGNNSDKDRTP